MNELWLCGFCGKSEQEFRYGDYRHAPAMIVMAQHAYSRHDVEVKEIGNAKPVGRTWVLPDGRVWIRREDA